MIGAKFPISDYYKGNILDARTISRGGTWWTAVLLLRDPRTQLPFVSMYRWQMTESGWKTRKRFSFRSQKDIQTAFKAASEFGEKLLASSEVEQADEAE